MGDVLDIRERLLKTTEIDPIHASITGSNLSEDDKLALKFLLEEIEMRRESEIRPAIRFIENSPGKQILHMASELLEVVNAWIMYKLAPTDENRDAFIREVHDLQFSCQTMLQGALHQSIWQVMKVRKDIIIKNNARGYNLKKK